MCVKEGRDTLRPHNLEARVGSYLPILLYNEDFVCLNFNRIDEFGEHIKYEFPM